MNKIEEINVMEYTDEEFEALLTAQRKMENRKYLWKAVRKGVKWTLLTAGAFAIVGHFVPEKNTTQEVK